MSPHWQGWATRGRTACAEERRWARYWVGIDVAKTWLDVARSDTEAVERYANTAAGITQVLALLADDGPAGIVLEASGGYEQAAVTQLWAAGLPVAVINPERARSFARALGTRAKTDALDARMLAHFGARMQPEPRPQPEETSTALGDLVTRRRQLQEMLTAEQNRHERASARMRPGIEAHLDWLRQQLAELEQEIAQVDRRRCRAGRQGHGVALDPRHRAGGGRHAARGAAGVGHPQPTGGRRPGRGRADQPGQRGAHRGARHRRWTRLPCARPLYMAALTASRCGAFKPFYDRLRAAGKPPKVALVALMRKLVVVANALLRDGHRPGPPPSVWSDRLTSNTGARARSWGEGSINTPRRHRSEREHDTAVQQRSGDPRRLWRGWRRGRHRPGIGCAGEGGTGSDPQR